MKILVCLSRFPYPIEKGDKLRAYYQIKELSKHHEISLICLSDHTPNQEDMKEVSKYCQSIAIIEQSLFSKGLNLLTGVFSSSPFQVHYFKSKTMKRLIAQTIASQHIDVCYVQMIRLAKNIPFGSSAVFYMDYMDALSEGMRKRIQFSKWYEKGIVAVEAKRLRKYEEKVAQHFDAYSIITSSDALVFSDRVRTKMSVIPNGISKEYFISMEIQRIPKVYDLIFTGNMGYHPNVQACKYLVNEILPLLKAKGHQVTICLAGVNPTPEVLALKNEQVTVTGFVKDIKEYLGKSRIFVAPLFSGSGLQNKLLEAMAAGLPTVTTSMANQALGATSNKEIMIADNAAAFAQAIAELLEKPTAAMELGRQGELFVGKQYDWAACNALLESHFNKLIKADYVR